MKLKTIVGKQSLFLSKIGYHYTKVGTFIRHLCVGTLKRLNAGNPYETQGKEHVICRIPSNGLNIMYIKQ